MGMLVKSQLFTAGRKYICIPRGADGRGWEDVAKVPKQKGKVYEPRKQATSSFSSVLASPEVGKGLEGECSLDPIQELCSKGW